MQVAVVGAGIAGLTAAVAFRRKGVEVTILEQAEELTEVGAGLQLSPNATRILGELDLLSSIEARWNEVDRVLMRSGETLRQLAEIPAGDFARRRWHAPYGVIHRADLQSVLLESAIALPGCRLLRGARIEATTREGIRGELLDRFGLSPSLVVGADGVWSSLRRTVRGSGRPSFSGYVAWRMVIDRREADVLSLDPHATTAFLGPRTHLVTYPMRGSSLLNVVAVTPGRGVQDSRDVCDAEDGRERLAAAFDGWNASIRSMLASSRDVAPWPLHEVAEGNWVEGDDIVLIGDAAHAMMPFAAQGAAMAIEDAFDLAECFVRSGAASLAAFAQRRSDRVARVRRRTAFNRFAYHARGPVRIGRDMVLAMRQPQTLAADLDWLYGYHTPAT